MTYVRCRNWDFGNGVKGRDKIEEAIHLDVCRARCRKYDDCHVREQKEVEVSQASEQPQTPPKAKLITRGRL